MQTNRQSDRQAGTKVDKQPESYNGISTVHENFHSREYYDDITKILSFRGCPLYPCKSMSHIKDKL